MDDFEIQERGWIEDRVEIQAITMDQVRDLGTMSQLFDNYDVVERIRRARELRELLEAKKEAGPLGITEKKIFIKFVCSDSRVVPALLNTGDDFIINIPLAGQAIGDDFPIGELEAILPYVDGIIMEAHDKCGACAECKKATAAVGGDRRALQGSLMPTVRPEIKDNLTTQVANLDDKLGQAIVEHGIAVISAFNHILREGKEPYSIITASRGFPEGTKAAAAFQRFSHIVKGYNEDPPEIAPAGQTPGTLFINGLSMMDCMLSAMEDENALFGNTEYGQIFGVYAGPQGFTDGCAVESAGYIMNNNQHEGAKIDQIVIAGASEAEVREIMIQMRSNPAFQKWMMSNPNTEIVGVIIVTEGDNAGAIDTDNILVMNDSTRSKS